MPLSVCLWKQTFPIITYDDKRGKGVKDRIVPINDKLAAALDEWKTIIGDGFIARRISKGGAIGDSLSAVGVFHIVRNAGKSIGKPDLAPHDLRRTFAQLGYEAGVPITQILSFEF